MDQTEQPASPFILRHSVVADAIGVMRGHASSSVQFRNATRQISRALAYEATRNLPLESVTVETPLEQTAAGALVCRVIAVPILRAGLWMLDGFLDIIPQAAAGFIGLRRNEQTLVPHEYYRNLPDVSGAHLFLLDPMLATGGSITAALAALPLEEAASVSLLSIIAAPEGVQAVTTRFANARLYIAALDRQLNDQGYILPGLGDAGDRLCDTL